MISLFVKIDEEPTVFGGVVTFTYRTSTGPDNCKLEEERVEYSSTEERDRVVAARRGANDIMRRSI